METIQGNILYGECAKHKGENMINCSSCAMEKVLRENKLIINPSLTDEMKKLDEIIEDRRSRISSGLFVLDYSKKLLKHYQKQLQLALREKSRITQKPQS